MRAIRWVGFDGDDTLWKSEEYYRAAEQSFEALLGQYIDLGDHQTSAHLLAVERRNLRVFGYGAKGMTLSMIEAAIELTDARISARDIQRILDIGRATLDHPVELIEGIRDAVAAIASTHEIVLITKGDLFHQEAKIQQSGLSDLFHRIEIVSEKDSATYARVIDELGVAPAQFAMVGNSMRSDIAPVVGLGGWGVHVPYHITWAHEAEHDLAEDHPRMLQIVAADALPEALARIDRAVA
ncbi:MAG: HAD family hydrolase [Pseudoxanthomonas sp.]